MRAARTDDEVHAALRLRYRVFCEEQGVDLAAERDGRDPEALQLVALDDGRVLGTCRVLLDDGLARLGRMAVEPGHRGRGLGEAVLLACLVDVAAIHEVCEVAWIGPRAFYERSAGVLGERRLDVLIKELQTT